MTLSSKKTQARPISMKKQLHQEGSFPYYRLGSIERFLLSDRQKKDAERGASKAKQGGIVVFNTAPSGAIIQ